MALTFGSLFSGCGGMDLGFEWAGLQCKWQVEIDDYATKVLERHWPDVPKFRDVREFPPAGGFSVDVICGGFPCQDISQANVVARVGLNGSRSGLWAEYLRVVQSIRPEAVVVENSYQQWRKWVPVVRRQLSEVGYESVPLGIDSAVFGTKHSRKRAFVVAHSDSDRQSAFSQYAEASCLQATSGRYWQDWGQPSPAALGMAHGVAGTVDRLRCAGNAVVPQVAQWIGQRLMEASPKEPATPEE